MTERFNKIILKDIKVTENKVEYIAEYEGEISQYFTNIPYVLEYSEPIDKVPYAILVIPWLCNMLPIIWLTDSELIIDELDLYFHESIAQIKQGYINKYPMLSFEGLITINRLIDCSQKEVNPSHKSIITMSGGVDSIGTIIRYIKDNPLLLSIWGSDIPTDNIEEWDILKKQLINSSKALGLKNIFVKSSFRQDINYQNLNNILKEDMGYCVISSMESQ